MRSGPTSSTQSSLRCDGCEFRRFWRRRFRLQQCVLSRRTWQHSCVRQLGHSNAAQSTRKHHQPSHRGPRIQRAAISDSKLVTTAATGLSTSTQSDSFVTIASQGAASAHARSSKAIQQALSIFELLTRIVRERRSHLIHFADAINVRWLLLFFHPRADRRAAELAMHILARLLQVPQLGYAQRLGSSGGIKFWNGFCLGLVLATLLPILWSTLFRCSGAGSSAELIGVSATA